MPKEIFPSWENELSKVIASEQFGQRNKLKGDYSEGDHLFPFRTEKLSPSTLMVLDKNPGE